MRFLFNSTVLDVGRPVELIDDPAFPLSRAAAEALSVDDVLELIRGAVYESQNFAEASPEKAGGLVAVLATKVGANALLAVRPDGAGAPRDVLTRLATVALTTIAELAAKQDAGPLSPVVVNEAVWSNAG